MHTQMERKEEERPTDRRTERSVIDGIIWMYMDGGIWFFDAFILLGNFHHANQMTRVIKVVERGVPQMSVPLAPPLPSKTPPSVGPYIRVESGGCLFHKCPHF
jgi:hypothetical protein